MALEDKLTQQPEADGNARLLTEEEEQDLQLAVLLGKRLIDEGGKEVITAANNSSDPGQVIGQFLVQLGSQLVEQLPKNVQLSPAIFLSKHGWLEQISDFLQEEYDVSKKVMDRAEIYVASTAQQMAQQRQAPASAPPQPAPQEQPPSAPVLPQGGMPNG